jgi:hypothetical protein
VMQLLHSRSEVNSGYCSFIIRALLPLEWSPTDPTSKYYPSGEKGCNIWPRTIYHLNSQYHEESLWCLYRFKRIKGNHFT